jgi:hypothetical protein
LGKNLYDDVHQFISCKGWVKGNAAVQTGDILFIRAHLLELGIEEVPLVRTITSILTRHELIVPLSRVMRSTMQGFEHELPMAGGL